MDKMARVLLLDDEQSVLKLFQGIFSDEPFGVVATTDPQEALALLEGGNIKVIVSDQRMPVMTGIDFLRKVKECYPDIIRILLTAYTEFSVIEEAINIGEVYRFISKPWTTTELKATIRQALDHYDLLEENKRLLEDTQTKNLELELVNKKFKALYETQQEFTSIVSHELRTPLTSIKMGLEIVLSGTSGPLTEDQKKMLKRSEDNANRLRLLINDFIDFSKLEAGKAIFDMAFNDINELIREMIAEFATQAREKGLYLKTELDGKCPPIPCDQDKMHQVFVNLMTNALKSTEKGGITVSNVSRPESNHIEICFKDTGMGISADDLPKMFQKFQRFSDIKKSQKKETGLGLAICREIVKQHGGKIWVESVAGEGTEFHFILPIQERRKE